MTYRCLCLTRWPRSASATACFYRYFDATPHAEFLYACVQQTIDQDLPREIDFLRRYDLFRSDIQRIADMPGRTLDLLFRLLHQNNDILSRRGREKEFAELTDPEVQQAQDAYALVFTD